VFVTPKAIRAAAISSSSSLYQKVSESNAAPPSPAAAAAAASPKCGRDGRQLPFPVWNKVFYIEYY
jgi:hypothetical protein